MHYFFSKLADSTTRAYLLHDRALRSLTSQEVVQMAQTCEASRLSLHAPAAAAISSSSKVAAPTVNKCAHDDLTAAPAWQQKSARDGRAKRGAHSSRKDDHRARSSAPRTSYQQQAPATTAHKRLPSDPNPENSARAPAEQAKSAPKQRAITCVKCGKSGHVATACNSDAPPSGKCYACGGVGHLARECATRAAQAKTQSVGSNSNAVASAGKGAAQVFASAVIAGVRIQDALFDTGSAFSMLSSAIHAKLLDPLPVQPFTRAAPDVVGLGGASAELRGYVDAPVELAGVTVHHPLLVVEGLAFPLLIGTDIPRSHRAVLTLYETAPVRLRNRECPICKEQRTELPAVSSPAPLTACAACSAIIEPCTAAFIRVLAPSALRKQVNLAAEPIASLLEKLGCAVIPFVYEPVNSELFLLIANPSNS